MKFNRQQKIVTLFEFAVVLITMTRIYFRSTAPLTADYHNLENKLYVFSAYRVTDDEIRIAMVKSHLSTFFYSFNGSLPMQLQIECQRDGECPAVFTPPCILSGYVGVIKDKQLSGVRVESVILMSEQNRLTVKIRDVRRSVVGQRKHKLGVCVQPIFMHADWPLFVQFFEYWLNEHATKFYIYNESYTDEVKRVIEFYTANSRADIEVIEWSKLPVDDLDPNMYWYRIEAFTAIFDCMHRARWHVHYVAQLDLDELIHLVTGGPLINYLEWLESKHLAMASVNFLSRRVQIPNYWDQVSTPLKLNFDALLKADFENQAFKRPLYTKNIYIPERVKRFDIHHQKQTELISPASNHSFVHLNSSAHHGFVLHLRRFIDPTFWWSGSTPSKALRTLAYQLKYNYHKRLLHDRTGIFHKQQWNNVGFELVMAIERCRLKLYKSKMEKCYSLSVCEPVVYKQFSNLNWNRANNSWHVLE